MLIANNLQLWRGDRHVLRGVSFCIREGEALHVWGPNGAGKTTLLRVMCGLLPVEEGDIQWRGASTRGADSTYVKSLASAGKCVLLSTHMLNQAEDICQRIGVIGHGRVLGEGTVEELCAQTGAKNLRGAFFSLVENGSPTTL